ncbi:autophagy-related protein 13-domain-containing protein [Pilobolus umbonatus]|nr:autophagy-related protein 13-domain-containing protein [Pilobolus umbonatus]
MVVDIYLDVSKLSHNQSLVIADDNLRWGRIPLHGTVTHILIESWELTLNHPTPDYPVDLPNVYKRSIVFFRSLHSLVRLLPAYELYRRFRTLNDGNPLSIGYRLSTATPSMPSQISLNTNVLVNDARKPTMAYSFSDIITPLGTFKLNVVYRRNCDFKAETIERDLSAQFIDMDDQFFTPTLTKYQEEKERQKQTVLVSKNETRSRPIVSPFKSPSISTSTIDLTVKDPVKEGSLGRKIEFSSSFDKYKYTSRDSSLTQSSLMKRRASDHSSILNDDDLEDFVRLMGSNQELKLFQKNETKDDKVLAHFQNLRDTHTSLSESVSSSMILSLSSPSSSIGRSYQPIHPSPLHTVQKSSPVHIPRSLPTQHQAHSNHTASTYPQDRQQEIYHSRKKTIESERVTQLEDDDSLVFKMSELGCDSQSSHATPLLFNRTSPTDRFK